MRPPNIRRAITAYPRWMNADGLIKPIRCVLPNTFWEDAGNTIARQTGNIVKDNTFVQVFYTPDARQYIAPHLWLRLAEHELDGYWTADLEQPPILVPWESDYEFDFATSDKTTRAENEFVRENPGAIRAATINNNMRGTERSMHISISGS